MFCEEVPMISKSFVSMFILFSIFSLSSACNRNDGPDGETNNSSGLLSKITMPPGFHINYYARNIPGARSMTLSQSGTLFVGTRGEGKVYAIVDTNHDGHADKVFTIANGLNMPNGVALRNGSLYVAEVNRVLRYDNIESHLVDPPLPVVVNDSFPSDGAHGWKFIGFGPDGKLYVPVGVPCNVCEENHRRYGSIMRMNADGTGLELYASGIRNTVG